MGAQPVVVQVAHIAPLHRAVLNPADDRAIRNRPPIARVMLAVDRHEGSSMAIPRFVSSGDFPRDVRIAHTHDQLQKIWALRYQVYVEKYQHRVSGADHKHRLLRDPHDATGIHLMVESAGEVLACATMHAGVIPRQPAALLQLWRFPDWSVGDVGFVSKFMIRHDHRRSMMAGRMMRAILFLARKRHTQALFCIAFPNVVTLYQRAGMAVYGALHVDIDLGPVRTMVVLVDTNDTLTSGSFAIEDSNPLVERPVMTVI